MELKFHVNIIGILRYCYFSLCPITIHSRSTCSCLSWSSHFPFASRNLVFGRFSLPHYLSQFVQNGFFLLSCFFFDFLLQNSFPAFTIHCCSCLIFFFFFSLSLSGFHLPLFVNIFSSLVPYPMSVPIAYTASVFEHISSQ